MRYYTDGEGQAHLDYDRIPTEPLGFPAQPMRSLVFNDDELDEELASHAEYGQGPHSTTDRKGPRR